MRDADSWVRSMGQTITQVFMGDTLMYHLARAQYHIDPLYAAWIDLLTEMNWGDERGAFAGTNGEPAEMGEAMERWNQTVIDTVPSDRLLVWHPKDGWEPLCELLDVPVPDGRSRTSTTPRTSRRTSSWVPQSARSTPGGRRTVSSRIRPRSARPGRPPLRPRAPVIGRRAG